MARAAELGLGDPVLQPGDKRCRPLIVGTGHVYESSSLPVAARSRQHVVIPCIGPDFEPNDTRQTVRSGHKPHMHEKHRPIPAPCCISQHAYA